MNEHGKYHLEMTLEEVNMVLKSLGKLPFEEVYGLIHGIHNQMKAQLQPSDEGESQPVSED